MLRVLWISHNVPYPPRGGVLQRNYHLIAGLSRGAEVHLLALRQRALCPDDAALDEAREALARLCRSVRVFEIDWERSALERARLAASLAARSPPYDAIRFASRSLERFLRSGGAPAADLVHLDTLGLLAYRPLLPPLPTVLNHHNVESQMLERRAENAGPGRRLLYRWQARRTRAWEARYAPSVATNLVVSELDEARLQRLAPGARTDVVANGVDLGYFDGRANDDPAGREIVFVGAQSWYPNGDAARHFLESIWPRVLAREPEARWTVIGRSPAKPVVRAAERDARIRVLGFVDDLRPHVERAAVFVCPFREGGGTRLKVLDALAMRKAVVSTSLGVEGIPLEDERHFLRADAPEPFADRVVELLRDPPRRARLGRAGRAFVEERFGWDAIAARLRSAYDAAVATAARRA